MSILNKYPDRIPVICEKSHNDTITPEIDKQKYLVPNDLTVGQFIYVIRKRMSVNVNKALFVFINNKIPPSAQLLSELYMYDKHEDEYLYITYSFENTFG